MRRGGTRAGGYSLLELVVALPIMALAFGLFLGSTSAAKELRQVQRENTAVVEEARIVLERMRNEDWSEVWALYNAIPGDDPGGAGTAPGNRFSIAGLAPPGGAVGDPVGQVFLPAFKHPSLGWQLREDRTDTLLGLPRDLSGDEEIDTYNHSGDYTVLPVVVKIEWQGAYGPRELTVHTVMTEYRR